jgi:hypothetical protein
MKKAITRIAVSMITQLITVSAFAGLCIPTGGGSGDCVRAGCAPEVLTNNVEKTDEVLVDLANAPQFKSATEFRRTVAKIQAADSAGVKMTKYLALVGIDAKDSKAVVGFLGQRMISKSQVSLLMTNTGLNADQARVLIESLSTSLRGPLK